MRPSGRSSQSSSICGLDASPIPGRPGCGLRSPAGLNFSSGFWVSVGNEILAYRFLLIDIASIAFGESKAAPLLFCSESRSTARRGKPRLYRDAAETKFCAFVFLLYLPSNFFSTRMALSTCFSSSRNGGRKRRTVSWVTLKSTPSANPCSTKGRAGMSSTRP